MSKTHIFVVRMKEIIYTGLFLIFAAVLILLLIFMFGNKDKNVPTSAFADGTYIPGIYTSSIKVNDNVIDVCVAVDSEHINGVSLINLEEAVAAMYPLLEVCTDDISSQLSAGVPAESLTCDANSQFTFSLLADAIQKALNTAKIQ